jgi:hypothetical protein
MSRRDIASLAKSKHLESAACLDERLLLLCVLQAGADDSALNEGRFKAMFLWWSDKLGEIGLRRG